MSQDGEGDAYPLHIEAEVGVSVQRTGISREILEFSGGNVVYECFQLLLKTERHFVWGMW